MIPKTEGIVLKSFDYRETSKIATFYTKEYGKFAAILKGIRKDQKKFGSNVDKFSVNDIVYYRYSRSDLHLISQCDLKQFFFPIRLDYKRNLAANYCLEMVDTIMQIDEINKDVYQLMLYYLNALEHVDDIDKLVRIFQIKILQLSGFSPHLDSCVKTRKRIEGKARFSNKEGGLVAQGVKIYDSSYTLISKGTISTILHVEGNSFKNCLKLGLTKNVRKELKFLLNNFLIYHLERNIKSSKYL